MRNLSALVLSATALAGSGFFSIATAQESANAVVEDHAYVRIGGGASWVSDWAQNITYNPTITFPAAPLAPEQAIEYGTGWVGGAALGYDYADGIRTELEYRYASTPIDAVTPATRAGFADPVNDDAYAHFIMSNFYFDLHNQSALTPFIGGGVGGAFVTNENDDRDAALAWQVRGGVSLAMGGGFSADLEYNYLQSNKLVYGPADEDFAVTTDPVRIDDDRYQASSVMFSIRKAF